MGYRHLITGFVGGDWLLRNAEMARLLSAIESSEAAQMATHAA